MAKLKEVVHRWKIEMDNIDNDDPCDVQIQESEREHTLEGRVVETTMLDYTSPIKTKKHNIVTKEAPKMAIIGDY
jgi:hypothetical protein